MAGPVSDGSPPVVFPHRIYVNTYSFGLTACYILIAILVIFQITRILCYRHNWIHYQFAFLMVCGIWSILRAVFWLVSPWQPLAEMILQFFSIWLQFATFAFLALFFVQVVYKGEGYWSTYKVKVFTIYSATIAFFFLCYILAIILSIEFGIESRVVTAFLITMVGVMFITLSGLLSLYMFKMWRLNTQIKAQLPLHRTKTHLLITTVVLVIVFMSRAIRSFVAAFGIGAIDFLPPDQYPPWEHAVLFFMYFVWEVLPTGLVIVLFWHIPHTPKLFWGKFDNGYQEQNISYDGDMRRVHQINGDTSGTDDSSQWDTLNHGKTYHESNQDSDEEFNPSTPDYTVSHFQGHWTPYNTQSPLLSKH